MARSPAPAASSPVARGAAWWVGVLLLAALGLTMAAFGLAGHGPQLVLGDGDALDVLATLVGLAGLGLVVGAFTVALRGRALPWKLAAIPVVLLLLQFYVFPVVVAGLAVNADRFDVAPAASLGVPGARDVVFPAADGTELSGWYVPGRGRAAVVLAHGSHGSREAVRSHLMMLVELGYGVLAFDARGHGESSGDPNALGWRGDADVEGAVRFLRGLPEVDPNRVGVLGLSMGGEEALRAAADDRAIAAIVSDGAGASTAGDLDAAGASGLERIVNWVGMRATEALSGDDEPPPLTERVEEVSAPALLIASNADGELDINRQFERRIPARVRLWHVDADHTAGLERHPRAYRARVRAFFAEQL